MDQSNPSWSTLLTPRNYMEILYEDQISAALEINDIPLQIQWTKDMWEKILRSMEAGKPVGPVAYPGCEVDVALAVSRWLPDRAVALVIGSVSPWVEAILYKHGCREIYSLDLDKINSEVACLKTVTYEELKNLGIRADIIVSFSTVEHIGLGRYGDQVDWDGDIHWMNEFALTYLKPGGIQLLGVPVGEFGIDNISHHRIYGPERMERLLNQWAFVEALFHGNIFDAIPFAGSFDVLDWQKQPVLVLKPKG